MSELLGSQIHKSSKIENLIIQLVDEVSAIGSHIDGIKEASPKHMETAKKTFDEIAKYRGRPLFFPFLGSGVGHGAYVEVEDGSVKIDLINGIGIHIFGHSHPKILKASVRGALSDVVMQGNLEPGHEYAIMGKKLVEYAAKTSALKYAWLSTCGTMANENALKMARQKHTPAKMIMAMNNAFAGRSQAMAEVTDNPSYRQGLPEYHEVLRIPFYDEKNPQSAENSLRIMKEHVAKHDKNISVFTFEPMLGEGGYRRAPREYFIPMLEFCRQQKIAIWFDEVQTFMRTGEMFAFETLGLGKYVDICTVAKTLQTGATLYTEEYNPKPGLVSGTFSGSSSALAAGIECMDILVNENYLGPKGRINQIHQEFVGMLNRLNETGCKGQVREAGGMGLMIAFTPLDGGKYTVNNLLQKFYKNGMIAFSCGQSPYRVRFLVPAIITSKDIEVAAKIIEKSIHEMM
jgi:4-aminobutyrate aminotransferase-like enzyme